jgi:hypothetical protein
MTTGLKPSGYEENDRRAGASGDEFVGVYETRD